MTSSRKEIRDSVLKTTRQETNSTLSGLVNDYINIAIDEIANSGWAFGRKNFQHLWSFLRQKTTFTTTASTGDYLLPREVDKIALIRQTETPIKLTQVPDDRFFEMVPNPTDTGNPKLYRLWEEEGVATRLSTDDTIDVVSSSASDAGNSELSVSIRGYDSNGVPQVETYALNGTTDVTGTTTWSSSHELYVAKQKNTTGTITAKEGTAGTTLVTLGPTERNPKFKVITLYPTPSSAQTIYVEYYSRIPGLHNDSDVPVFDSKWHYVVRLGTLAKVFQYLNKETDFAQVQNQFASAVRAMVAADTVEPDLIDHLSKHDRFNPTVRIQRSTDAIA